MESESQHTSSPLEAQGFEPMNAPWLFDDDLVQHGRFAAPRKRRKRSKVLPVLSGLLVAGTVAGAVMIGVRLDNQHVDPAPASPSEIARQDLAVQAHRLGAHADELAASNPLYGDVAAHAHVWEESLGGVWVPWPDGTPPQGRTNPPLETEPPATPDAVALMSDLNDFAGNILTDSASREGSVRETFVRIALDAKLNAARIAEACGVAPPPAGAIDYAAVAAAWRSADQMNAVEEARQWLEREAATTSSADVASIDARIDSLNALQDELIKVGADDERAAVAPFPALADGETLTMKALDRLSSSFLSTTNVASAEQTRAIVAFLYSLYQSDAQRAAANVLP